MAPDAHDSATDHDVTVRADTMYRIHEVSRLISAYFDHLVAEHGITRAQWSAIMHVSQNPGATQTQLAELMQMGRAAAGKMLDRLEEKNWIERRDDPQDSRLRRVYPRSTTEPLHEVIPVAAIKLYDEFFAGMSTKDVEGLLNALNAMQDNGRRALDRLG